MTWAFGKAILLGEHAVVYGYPALAGAIDCPLRARFTPASASEVSGASGARGLRLRVPAWQLDVSITSTERASEHVVGSALEVLVREVGAALDAPGLEIERDGEQDVEQNLEQSLLGCIDIDTELPAAAGLGSSAALSVALARLLFAVLRPERPAPSDEIIEAIANCAERCFHDNPSGVDVALATRGGMGVFVRGQGLRILEAAPVSLAVGLSGQARRTADLVARVARARAAERARTDRLLGVLGEAAERGQHALERADLDTLGALMNRAHETLAELALSTDVLDRLVARARDAQALGAKLTGAGGGGAVIALGRDRPHAAAICQSFRDIGYASFTCTLGARP